MQQHPTPTAASEFEALELEAVDGVEPLSERAWTLTDSPVRDLDRVVDALSS